MDITELVGDLLINKKNNMDTKPWWQSRTIIVAILMGASGIVLAFDSQFPGIGWLMAVKAAIDIILRFYTTNPIA